jgi:hypothetical protein
VTAGASLTDTLGVSSSGTIGRSRTSGTSQTETRGISRTAGSGQSESVHRRPLIQPDEVGRLFARIDSQNDIAYPGLALVMITGTNPFVLRRSHYFEDLQFIDCFSPHPDHMFRPAIPNTYGGIRPLIDTLEAAMNGEKLKITKWFIRAGELTSPSQAAAQITRVPPDNRTVYIEVPCTGKVSAVATTPDTLLPLGGYSIPDGALFTVKNYPDTPRQNPFIDPFRQLREACLALEMRKQPPPKRLQRLQPREILFLLIMGFVMLLVLVIALSQN